MCKKNSKCAVSGKFKKLYRELENSDTEILSLGEGYTISFHKISQQKNIPNSPKLSQGEKTLVQKEIHKILNKGAIVETPNHLEGEFLSNLFLVEKKDEGNRQDVNLKHLNNVDHMGELQKKWTSRWFKLQFQSAKSYLLLFLKWLF